MTRWYRSQRRNYKERAKSIHPLSTGLRSTQSLLKEIRHSDEGRNFLESNLKTLLARAPDSRSAEYFYALATFQEGLGQFEGAKDSLEKALLMKLPQWTSLPDLEPTEFAASVRQMDNLTQECLWMREKVILSLKKDAHFHIKSQINFVENRERASHCSKIRIDRRNGSDLGVEDFLSEYVAKGKPVVISGMQSDISSSIWDLDLVLAKVSLFVLDSC